MILKNGSLSNSWHNESGNLIFEFVALITLVLCLYGVQGFNVKLDGRPVVTKNWEPWGQLVVE